MQPAHTRLAASFTRNLALAVSGDATRHCGAASAFHIASLPRGGRTEALPPRMCDRQEHALRKKKATILRGPEIPHVASMQGNNEVLCEPLSRAALFFSRQARSYSRCAERPEVCLSAGAAWCAPAGCGEFTRDPRAPLPCHEEIQKLCSGRLLSVQTVVSLRRECFRVQLSLTSS